MARRKRECMCQEREGTPCSLTDRLAEHMHPWKCGECCQVNEPEWCRCAECGRLREDCEA